MLEAWYAAPDVSRRLRGLATARDGISRGGAGSTPGAGTSLPRVLCVLLLPAPLERFILRDQAEDLLRAPGIVAVEPGRVPYGAYGRLPRAVAARLAGLEARRGPRALPAGGRPRAVAIFHALQQPVARALLDAV